MAQVTFTGEVVYVHRAFIAVKEDGDKGKRWQVWGGTGNVGDRVDVTGELKTGVAKPREEGGEIKYVDHSVNNGTVTPAGQAAAQHTPADDPWNAPSDDGMPF
jgi:hypothetical protein